MDKLLLTARQTIAARAQADGEVVFAREVLGGAWDHRDDVRAVLDRLKEAQNKETEMEHHHQIALSDYHRNNLLKLADFLEREVTSEGFDMLVFWSYRLEEGTNYIVMDYSDAVQTYNPSGCGTVGCALGYGLAAGIAASGAKTWLDYAYKAFGVGLCAEEAGHGCLSDLAYDWCFAGTWCWADNTPVGAAKRIRYMLQHGIPSNQYDMRMGRVPLCY